MKRMNNKGLTVIELLVCFSIISIIVVGLLKSINNYSDNATITSYKNEITTYKNTTTKYIMDKIINNEGVLKSDFETVDIEENKVTLVLENGCILSINIDVDNKKIDTVYKDYQVGVKETKSFKVPKIDNLKINPIKIEKYENFVDIYADFYLSDFGHTYSAIDLKIPVIDKNYDISTKLKHQMVGYISMSIDKLFSSAYNMRFDTSAEALEIVEKNRKIRISKLSNVIQIETNNDGNRNEKLYDLNPALAAEGETVLFNPVPVSSYGQNSYSSLSKFDICISDKAYLSIHKIN